MFGAGLGRGAIALTIAVVGCAANTTIVPGRSVVLSGDHAHALQELCSRPGVPAIDGTWVPSAEDVRAMEQRFGSLKRQRAKGCCMEGLRVRGDINEYRRQYVGIVVGGRRLIYINADAWIDEGPPPADAILEACDGGGSSWGVLYDPATGEFSDLAFNGVA